MADVQEVFDATPRPADTERKTFWISAVVGFVITALLLASVSAIAVWLRS